MADDSFTHQVTLGYDGQPVGTLRIDGVDERILAQASIVPALLLQRQGEDPSVMGWAIIPRTSVDTRPRVELGEESSVPLEIRLLSRIAKSLRNYERYSVGANSELQTLAAWIAQSIEDEAL